MDIESFKRLGLDWISNVDLEDSDEIYTQSNNNHTIVLRFKKLVNYYCPYCGLLNCYKPRSILTQVINHSSNIENNITVKMKRRVYICECGKTFRDPNPFTETKRKTSNQKIDKILTSLKDINKSFSDTAAEFNISVTSVQKIFDSNVDTPRLECTTVYCVDEVYAKHCGYNKYCFITYSPQLDKILDVLPSRNKEDLCGYFAKIPLDERKKVKYFSMDLYDVYKQVAELCFPNALVCADHFHVIKNLNDCFNSARIRIMKKYEHLKNRNDNYYWLYKKYWKKLLKASDKLGYTKFQVNRSGLLLDEHQIVDYMLKIDKDLKDAYELLNEYRAFNSTATADDAEESLNELINKFHDSPLDEYYKAYKMLKKWKKEIINSFNRVNGFIISNGGMERANRDIKTIIRHAYGYKNFDRLRKRIMYVKNR